MYFSGEKGEHITFDDPDSRCIRTNPDIYSSVQNDNERNARVFLDTPLLRIRGLTPEHDLPIDRIGPIVSKCGASVSLETRVFIPALVYVTNSITTAEFRESPAINSKQLILLLLITFLGSPIPATIICRSDTIIHSETLPVWKIMSNEISMKILFVKSRHFIKRSVVNTMTLADHLS